MASPQVQPTALQPCIALGSVVSVIAVLHATAPQHHCRARTLSVFPRGYHRCRRLCPRMFPVDVPSFHWIGVGQKVAEGWCSACVTTSDRQSRASTVLPQRRPPRNPDEHGSTCAASMSHRSPVPARRAPSYCTDPAPPVAQGENAALAHRADEQLGRDGGVHAVRSSLPFR
uniref:Uncharacterized protein n=1 Tax=Eutreptiella gymnastica TaxID=73025 RepID=A0A7S4LFS5_9EUGL